MARMSAVNARLKDGAILLTTVDGVEGSLLTVRGKDHDLTPEECRTLARALLAAADLHEEARP